STTDIFVHDRLTGTTERVSTDSSGAQGNGPSTAATISGDGRFVVFESLATNLVPLDLNRRGDVFVHDRVTGTTERVSVNSRGGAAPPTIPFLTSSPSISSDGSFVAFNSAGALATPVAPDLFTAPNAPGSRNPVDAIVRLENVF